MRDLYKKIIIVLLICLPLAVFADDFFDDFSEDEGSSLEINGSAQLGLRGYFSDDILEDTPDVDTDVLLTLKYTGSIADITIKSKMDRESVILDECYTNIYFDIFNVEAGILKTVWGKGDKLHVVDMLNPMNYSEYFINDYLENKIATPTIKINVPLGNIGLLELAYIPVFQGDLLPTVGRWVPSDVTMLLNTITTMVKTNAATNYGEVYAANIGTGSVPEIGAATGAAMAASLQILQDGSDISQYYQDTDKLSFGQFGLRGTTSLSGFDLGALYYFGYNKQPVLNTEKMLLEYEPKQMIGLEFGKALFGFNLRAEGAYYLMKDSDDSLNYLAGLDYNLPIHNLNINVQLKGNYMLDSDIDNTNMFVGKLSDTFNHEKVSLSVTGIYYLESEDYMIKPEFSTNIGDTIKLNLSSSLFSGLGRYDKNDYLAINVNYMF